MNPPPSILSSEPEAQIWINGRLVPLNQALLSPLDQGFLLGDGIFETLVAEEGKPFAARRHWLRLVSSCEAIGLPPPAFEICLAAMLEVMVANRLQNARLRLTLTRGFGGPGTENAANTPTMMVSATALKKWPPKETAILVPWTRNERGALAGIKSTSFGENVRALAHAKTHGAGEALFANTRGELCEGSGTNLFLIENGVVKTPPLDSGCLPGITRALVLEACAAAGIPAEQVNLPTSSLKICDEAFLTSSTRGVHPLSKIDHRTLPASPGPQTRQVSDALRNFIAERSDP